MSRNHEKPSNAESNETLKPMSRGSSSFDSDVSFYAQQPLNSKSSLPLENDYLDWISQPRETPTSVEGGQLAELDNLTFQDCSTTPNHHPSVDTIYENTFFRGTDNVKAAEDPAQAPVLDFDQWRLNAFQPFQPDDYVDLDEYLDDLNSIITEEEKLPATGVAGTQQLALHDVLDQTVPVLQVPPAQPLPATVLDVNTQRHHSMLRDLLQVAASPLSDSAYYGSVPSEAPSSFTDSPLQSIISEGDFNHVAPRTVEEMDSQDSESQSTPRPTSKSRADSRFWQYNSQSKGPKGKKFKLSVPSDQADPHRTVSFIDPVFAKSYKALVKHVGKARKGDGNDMTPDPPKLAEFGRQIEKLNTEMDVMNSSAKGATKKEKNRLASQACRLKKKAHNEANKIKLHYIRREQEELLAAIKKIKSEMSSRQVTGDTQPLMPAVNAIKASMVEREAAGKLPELVDEVLYKVSLGDKTGGLDL